jgi:two-component system, LuxR family, response regulator FixJ
MSTNKSDFLVYLVDDEFAVRDSLTLLIKSTSQAVRSFESAEAFLNNYDPEKPGCLLLDVRMPVMSGLELQDELLRREISIPIIFISGHAGIPDSAKAFRAGAVDFLEKPFDDEVLLERIEEAIKKDIVQREQLIDHREIQNRLDNLTVREQEVLSLIIRGHSNKDAARKLNISARTVEVHRAHIMEKMKAENLVELMMMARQCNLIE